MTENKPKCVLARDRDGAFYEIPVEEAKRFLLPMEDLPKALEFHGKEPIDQEGLQWSKMTGWGGQHP